MNEINHTRICVPVCADTVAELAKAAARAAAIGDLIEFRLDCLAGDELADFLRDLPALLKAPARPLILTLRPAAQGGRRELDDAARARFWTQFFKRELPANIYADIELDVARFFLEREAETRVSLDWQRVICSHHDFTGAASGASKIYEQLRATPARCLKIAVRARDVTDCLPLFHLLDRAQREGRELIAVAMGEAGLPTRILGPSRGARLTYGALDEAHRVAPGQITASALRDLYRLQRLDRRAIVTGLVGSSIAHSVSPQMHNAAFEALDLSAVYIPFETQELRAFVTRMVHPRTREMDWNLRGLSVTAPHKEMIIEHLDSIDSAAEAIGAVNTVIVDEAGLRGFNTDVTAFIETLRERAGALAGLRCAVIGAGGAARGVLWGLRQEGALVTLFARDAVKAAPLAEKFGAAFSPLAEAGGDGFDVVINTTPLGTRGQLENETPVTARQLRGARLAYDLVYNPSETRFLREALEAGCDTIGGLPMLVAQAAEQFQLWTGMKAPVELMSRAAREAIRSQLSAVSQQHSAQRDTSLAES